ncbi:MAG TPA: hypothetical protein VHX86_10485 [Tepidisphaeraceae bacterium]|nr:hypothetical protein [Tepidisphaeraceae bacterium]
MTDYELLHSIITAMLPNQSFVLTLLQPEQSIAFIGAGAAGSTGGGWRGVYHWTLLLLDRVGRLGNDTALFGAHELFIMHLDADVAAEDPTNDRNSPIPALAGILPCEEPCPPPSATTNRLRNVMLDWLGETALPQQAVLCTPSKSTEAWVVPICCPDDKEAAKSNWECRPKPENRLGQTPKKKRFSKRQDDYRGRRVMIAAGWAVIVARLSEAKRFNDEFCAAVAALPE